MKILGWCIGLSLALWSVPAKAENWQIVSTSVEGAITEINFDSLEHQGANALYVLRYFLRYPESNKAQVYVVEMETNCQTFKERKLQWAAYTLNGKRLHTQKKPERWESILLGSVSHRVYTRVCPSR
ncbi:hypothetical protein LEP3755_04360 [Leptolyngbya sp. NIES-3755]|nr:hypothetical protein LEP3755_04360 [Leptolyngbya sp. NIES-3755]